MNKQHHPTRDYNAGRMWAGIIILSIGAALLAGRLGLDWIFPPWLFNWHNLWPLVLIIVGLVIGGNSNFRNPVSIFLIGFGGFFLLKEAFHVNIGPIIWPVVIIGIGLWLLSGRGRPGRPRGPYRGNRFDPETPPHSSYEWDKRVTDEPKGPASSGASAFDEAEEGEPRSTAFTNEDYVKSTAVFSEVKKTLISKRFQGGEIVNIFGGTDINLIQADIQHPIVIDVFQLFAGTKIIVPAHWKVQSEMVSVFGEVDDRRFTQGIPHDEQKVLYIKGTSIFGGITIKNI
ncbi:LiaF transmembrane domain-containing protein [Parapedobacter sp. DT-150]|uniref:LiaF transmembrane domain-containing protein n=1 Tax=Parapedobacter sp. DT-150 TaxID=3396162 RepID=UPI003F1AEFEC